MAHPIPRPSKRRKIIKRSLIALLVVALLIGGYTAVNVFNAFGNIFKENPLGALFAEPLKTDQYGRSNILVFGTAEDDPGHPASDLTDSVIALSVDQKKKNAFMFSVPRDLWVDYGRRCPSGSAGKVNVVYSCVKSEGEDTAQTALRNTVGEAFGMDFQYSVHLNYTAVRSAVDALGGITVTIESVDPRGVLDRNFDWRCRYRCNLVKYPNGPVQLDGQQALYLAQARGEGIGYGFPRGNFDREANQRKIILAMKQKATSIGFLANPLSVNKLLSSLGNNVRTNISGSEFKTLTGLIKDIPANNIESISIVDQKPALLTTGRGPDGSSIVRPVAGLYDYNDLQAFITKKLNPPPPPKPATPTE